MPELPEVEFARLSLTRWLVGATLERVAIADGRILAEGSSAAHVEGALVGRHVEAVDRRGKWLRLRVDGGLLLFSHLGMTGKWVAIGDDGPPPHALVEVESRRGGVSQIVAYVDPRRFGRLLLAEDDLPAWRELGPDPLLDGIDARALHAALAKRRTPVKVALLDQALLAGIGNIQATEALFFARVDPRRSAGSLTLVEVRRLASGLRRTIRATLVSQRDGLTYLGEGGPNPFTIYGREGTPCPRCRATLAKLVLAGRGTVFCATCQREGQGEGQRESQR